MKLQEALIEDVLQFVRSVRVKAVSIFQIRGAVAPLRDKEVREAVRELVRRRILEQHRHGHYVPAYYSLIPVRRF